MESVDSLSSSSLLPASSTFPQTPEQFDDDPRVAYSKVDQKWILENDDGTEFEYDLALKRWIPSVDAELLEQQGEVYAIAGVDGDQAAQPAPRKKRRVGYEGEKELDGPGVVGKKVNTSQAPAVRKNTAVYVTNLPPDATVQEVQGVFSRCGVIAEEIDQGRPRIKIYTDEGGRGKGDALIVYFRAESVDLAVQMLDDTDFRLGEAGTSGKMKVQPADFSYKNQQGTPNKINAREKKKIIKKTQKLNNKLADWDDDDPASLGDTKAPRDKIVILKHMFTREELEEDPAAILHIKDDIRGECAKLGEVTNVVLFDREDDGVVSVRFADAESALACVQVMNGRYFSGVQVEAYIDRGGEKFKKSTEKRSALEDDEDEEENQRLDQFGNWLEQGD